TGWTDGGAMVTGPAPVNPAPASAQPSPFRSVKPAVAPAVESSAFKTSWVIRLSSASNVAPGGHPWLSVQLVARIRTPNRYWLPFASGVPLPIVGRSLRFGSDSGPPAGVSQGFAAGSS